MIPRWLQDHLEATGRANTDGIGRAINTRTCPGCGQATVTGLDADVAALPARCDPHPVDQVGELIALATGRRTYDLTPTSGRLELYHRECWHIAARRRYPVLAQHACGQPLPAGDDITPRPRLTAWSETPEF